MKKAILVKLIFVAAVSLSCAKAKIIPPVNSLERLGEDVKSLVKEVDSIKARVVNLEGKTNNGGIVPVGTIFAYAGANAPYGFFECDGSHFNSSDYPELNRVLGHNWVPDLRGQFVRGWDHHAGVDKDRALGSFQQDAIRNITGRFDGNVNDGDNNKLGAFSTAEGEGSANGSDGRSGGGVIGFDASRVVPTANENRPKNVALMYIIKHDSVYYDLCEGRLSEC